MDPITYGTNRRTKRWATRKNTKCCAITAPSPAARPVPPSARATRASCGPSDALPLVRAGVLKAQGDEPASRQSRAAKMEERPLNKSRAGAPRTKRGPGRPRTNPPPIDDEDEA